MKKLQRHVHSGKDSHITLQRSNIAVIKTMKGKLKDSCDTCSGFKLRCDKNKPACMRCASLNRQCTYSLARRAGRPHSMRRGPDQSQNHSRGQKQSQSHSQNASYQQYFESTVPPSTDDSLVMEPSRTNKRNNSISGSDDCVFPETNITKHYVHSQPVDIRSSPHHAIDVAMDRDGIGTDCKTVALSIVKLLEMNKKWNGASTSYAGCGLKIADACQQLLTILVCPCSEQAEMALLVASACFSLLDLVHGSADGNPDQESTKLDNSYGKADTPISQGSSDQTILAWSQPWWSPQSFTSNCRSQVGELSKIAKVILEFTDRYCENVNGTSQWSQTIWMIAPVAALLRSRLQSITREATTRRIS